MPERPFKNMPDFEHLRAVLMRETADGPVPLLELLADPEIMSELTGIAYPAERRPMSRRRVLIFAALDIGATNVKGEAR